MAAAAHDASLEGSPAIPRVSKRASTTAASSAQPKKRQKKTEAVEQDFDEQSPTPEAAKKAPKARTSRAPPKSQRKEAAALGQGLGEGAEPTPAVINRSKREIQNKSCAIRERDQDGDGEAMNASGDEIERDVATEGSAAEDERMKRKGNGLKVGKGKLTPKNADSLRASRKTGRATVNTDIKRPETILGRIADSGSEMSVVLDTKPKPEQKRTSSGKVISKISNASRAGEIKGQSTKTNAENINQLETGEGAESDSEMSIVLDEPPKRKKKDTLLGKTKSSGTSKAGKRSEPPAEPDAEEIKRLQGWLVKCGVRKLWGKELAPYDTPKLKIRHLRDLLSKIGMTGRFSAEKAKQIREERELKADLEEVQEGAKLWGKEETGEDTSVKPRRRLARSFLELDFLNSDEGEETD